MKIYKIINPLSKLTLATSKKTLTFLILFILSVVNSFAQNPKVIIDKTIYPLLLDSVKIEIDKAAVAKVAKKYKTSGEGIREIICKECKELKDNPYLRIEPSLKENKLSLFSFAGVISGAGFQLDLINQEYFKIYHFYRDGSATTGVGFEDTIRYDETKVGCSKKRLILTKIPELKPGEEIEGALEFETNPYESELGPTHDKYIVYLKFTIY